MQSRKPLLLNKTMFSVRILFNLKKIKTLNYEKNTFYLRYSHFFPYCL